MDDIILQCENEIFPYQKYTQIISDIMIDSNGNNLMAYVSYVFTGDTDVPAAIVLAQTLINSGSRADRLVLITPDVSQDARNLLLMFYNKVIDVNYINISNIPLDKIQFKYIQSIFAKYYALTLVRYKKLLIVHPHSVILKYPDYVFTLDPPLTISVDKNEPIASSWYEEHCGTKKSKYYKFDGTINTNYLLLEPSMKQYNEIIDSLIFNLNNGIINSPEIVILTNVYSNWNTVNPRFMAYSGLPHWKLLYGTNIDINNITTTKDYLDNDAYVLWFDIYKQILNTHPEFVNNLILKNYNKLAVRYLSRSKKQEKTEYEDYYSMYNLKEIYKQTIHLSQSKYYHLDRFNVSNTINPLVMFDNIDVYDFVSPIQKLSEYFGENNYYSQILPSLSFTQNKPLHKYNYLEPHVRDLIMLEYTKCRNNMYIIMLLPNIKQDLAELDETIKYLGEIGNVAYIKTMAVNQNSIKNLLFWWFNDVCFQSRTDIINDMFKNIKILDENNPITFIFFDDVKNIGLSKHPENKEKLINKLLEINNCKYNMNILINNYFYETIEYSQIILNKNTLDLINYCNIDKLSNSYFSQSNLQYQTFRNAVYNNFSLLEISRIIITDDVCLYSLGIRNFDNIDAVFVSTGHDNSSYEKYLETIISDNFSNKRNKINFINLNTSNSKQINKIINNKILEDLDISNMTELITNPNNYCYFQGIKMYKIDGEIIKKMYKQNNLDILDLFMMNVYLSNFTKHYMSYSPSDKIINLNKSYSGKNKLSFNKKIFKNKLYLKNDIKLINK